MIPIKAPTNTVIGIAATVGTVVILTTVTVVSSPSVAVVPSVVVKLTPSLVWKSVAGRVGIKEG